KSDEVLLRTGFFVENKSRLDAVMRLLPDARLRGAILAAKEHALWPEALSLIVHLTADFKGRLGNLVAEQSDDVLEDLAAAAQRDLWPTAIGLLTELPEKIQQQLGTRAADGLRDVYAEIRRAAESLGLLASLSAVDVGYRAALEST